MQILMCNCDCKNDYKSFAWAGHGVQKWNFCRSVLHFKCKTRWQKLNSTSFQITNSKFQGCGMKVCGVNHRQKFPAHYVISSAGLGLKPVHPGRANSRPSWTGAASAPCGFANKPELWGVKRKSRMNSSYILLRKRNLKWIFTWHGGA